MCHYCHVMDEECYKNAEVARVVADVHRRARRLRRRPDLDARFQAAADETGFRAATHRVFLTPEGGVFTAAPTFRSARGIQRGSTNMTWGRNCIKGTGKTAEEGNRARNARARFGKRSSSESPKGPTPSPPIAGCSTADRATAAWRRAEVFVSTRARDYCFVRGRTTSSRAILTNHIATIVRGGAHDRIGGGFHRYCVRIVRIHISKKPSRKPEMLIVFSRAHYV